MARAVSDVAAEVTDEMAVGRTEGMETMGLEMESTSAAGVRSVAEGGLGRGVGATTGVFAAGMIGFLGGDGTRIVAAGAVVGRDCFGNFGSGTTMVGEMEGAGIVGAEICGETDFIMTDGDTVGIASMGVIDCGAGAIIRAFLSEKGTSIAVSNGCFI